MNIYDVLEEFGKTKNRNYTRARLKDSYNQYVELWRSYYSGNIAGINSDVSFNGDSFFPINRQSMKLAKQIATKWATMLFTEQFKVTLKNDTETEKFNELEKQIDFRSKINESAIEGYALGTSALLASADIFRDKETETVTGGKVKLDVVSYDSLFPLSFDKNDITSIAFVRTEQEKDATIYTISIHTAEGDQVTIETLQATVKGENVDFTPAEKITATQTFNNGMYAIIKPNVKNDYSSVLPFGASIFADALASCADIDLAADLLRNDIRDGTQLTFVGKDMVFEGHGKEGEKKKLFDSTRKFYVIPQKLMERGGDIKQIFEKSVPEIRTETLWKVIKDALNWACLSSGLGRGSLDIQVMQTATEVVHTEAEKMQNKSLHEQYLEGQIISLVKALCELSTLTGNQIDGSEVNITWQDSVVIDTGTEKAHDRLDVEAGLLASYEYRMKYNGETEQEARAKIEEIKKGNDPFEIRRDYSYARDGFGEMNE